MNKRSYTLGGRAARQLRRQMTSRPLAAPQRIDYRTAPTLIMVKIEAHEGAGVYRAQEVFWSGSAWATITNISRQFGALYGTAGVRHIAAATDTAVNTIVRAFAFSVNSATGLTDWFFQEGGGGAYTGPFDVTYVGAVAAIGATRGTPTRGSDYIIVHPDTLLKASQELVTVTGNGVVYYSIRREDWDLTAVSATPLYAAALPAHTTNTMMVPLAQVFFAAGAITGVRQIQYGNILIDKTSADYCP